MSDNAWEGCVVRLEADATDHALRTTAIRVVLMAKEGLLPVGFKMRPATFADIQSCVSLFNTCSEVKTGTTPFRVDQIQNEWNSPGFDPSRHTRVILAPADDIVGYVEVWDNQTPPVVVRVWARVHPEYEGQGLGTYMMTWAERVAREAIPRCPDDARVVMASWTESTYVPAIELFAGFGMEPVRHFWRMHIDFDEPPAPPSAEEWPEGITVRTYRHPDEARAVFLAAEDAFTDHWGHIPEPEESGLPRFLNHIEGIRDFDPALWFLAMDGDEIAGICLCRPHSDRGDDIGHVETLGVRRPWRRQGLAKALLKHSFAAMYEYDKVGADLGVDASSITGATRLYESVGMHVVREMDIYEKELRPGDDLVRRE